MTQVNNQDHSHVTAMTVSDGLGAGHVDRLRFGINTEQEYHEEKK